MEDLTILRRSDAGPFFVPIYQLDKKVYHKKKDISIIAI